MSPASKATAAKKKGPASRPAAAKAAAEEDLDAKTLLAKRDAEHAAEMARLQKQVDDKFATLELERQYLELKSYIQGRVAQEVATILTNCFGHIDCTHG